MNAMTRGAAGAAGAVARVAACAILLIAAVSCKAATPVEPAGGPAAAADPIASALASLVEHEAWAPPRPGSNDHGVRQALLSLYAANGQLLWSTDGRPTSEASALIRTLGAADAYGLEPRDYSVEEPTALPAAPAQRWARFDLSLSAAALRLVCDLHYGRIDPRAAGFDLGAVRHDDLDLAAVLRELARSDDIARTLASIEPQFGHYRLLEQALARYRLLAARDPSDRVLAGRVRQIDLTLERWRWLPPFQTPPIIVNIPQFRLFAFRSTQDRAADILQMDVIVGRTFPRTRTPVFVADMRYVVFRPYWDVPRSITLREMLPQIRSKPGFLAAQRLEIVRGATDAAVPVPATPQNLDALAAGQLRLRQRPGPDNALGLVKFVLPNSHDVYLHSTPARQLFRQERRAFSHGCIRVRDPVALAQYVLRDTPGEWTPEAIRAAMDGPDNRRVRLARPIRVLILYGTVLAKESGETLFFKDLYGYDRRLERLLGLAPIAAPPASIRRSAYCTAGAGARQCRHPGTSHARA